MNNDYIQAIQKHIINVVRKGHVRESSNVLDLQDRPNNWWMGFGTNDILFVAITSGPLEFIFTLHANQHFVCSLFALMMLKD